MVAVTDPFRCHGIEVVWLHSMVVLKKVSTIMRCTG
jgi:hypothetical protein